MYRLIIESKCVAGATFKYEIPVTVEFKLYSDAMDMAEIFVDQSYVVRIEKV